MYVWRARPGNAERTFSISCCSLLALFLCRSFTLHLRFHRPFLTPPPPLPSTSCSQSLCPSFCMQYRLSAKISHWIARNIYNVEDTEKNAVMWLMLCVICHPTECSLARWHVLFFRFDLEIHFWRGVCVCARHKRTHASECARFCFFYSFFEQIKNPGSLLNLIRKWRRIIDED